MIEKNRRDFLKKTSLAVTGFSIIGTSAFVNKTQPILKKDKFIGLVGMDTSHSPFLVKSINTNSDNAYKVTTAYTTTSNDLPASIDRVEEYSKQISDMGVDIVPTIEDLLNKVDYVLLSTVDGRLHLEQAEKILKAQKRVFIDKPMATSLTDIAKIFALSKKYNVPTFSSSAVRFMEKAQEVRSGMVGHVIGAQVFAPIYYEPTHPELYWYGIHGVELLYTVMKTGCKRVKRFTTEKFDIITGDWGEGKIGTCFGLKNKMQEYGGQVYGEEGVVYLNKLESLERLSQAILHYFDTGEVPVEEDETLELYAFMDAAQKSNRNGGDWVSIEEVLKKND